MSKSEKRIFSYDGTNKGKANWDLETKLSDDDAIKFLGGIDGENFKNSCAFEINKMKAGFKFSQNMVAWGFKLAEDAKNPPKALTLSTAIQKMVACRRPLVGENLKVVQHGARSKYCGQYTITDGGEYPSAAFYGRADKNGNWTPRGNTPQEVIDALTE